MLNFSQACLLTEYCIQVVLHIYSLAASSRCPCRYHCWLGYHSSRAAVALTALQCLGANTKILPGLNHAWKALRICVVGSEIAGHPHGDPITLSDSVLVLVHGLQGLNSLAHSLALGPNGWSHYWRSARTGSFGLHRKIWQRSWIQGQSWHNSNLVCFQLSRLPKENGTFGS